MSMILKEKYEYLVFRPYKYTHGLGDCAETSNSKNVYKESYGHNVSFKLAGRTMVKHAP